jgi:hypothetical protein
MLYGRTALQEAKFNVEILAFVSPSHDGIQDR